MTPDNLRRAARGLAKHRHLDPAACIMAGCIAASSSTYPTPSAEERAELLAVAESSDGFDLFIEAATSRAVQFVRLHWATISRHAEQLAGVSCVVG